MLGLRLSVPMALGRTRWHHTFPCKFIKSGQKRLQIPGLRDSKSSGLARRTNAKARLGEGVSWTSSFVRGRLVAESRWDAFVASFLLQRSTCFKGGQITKERRDRPFLDERLELWLDACLSARALSKLVMVCMNSRSSESQLALDSSETPEPYDVLQLLGTWCFRVCPAETSGILWLRQPQDGDKPASASQTWSCTGAKSRVTQHALKDVFCDMSWQFQWLDFNIFQHISTTFSCIIGS